jgi:hypothetical protein
LVWFWAQLQRSMVGWLDAFCEVSRGVVVAHGTEVWCMYLFRHSLLKRRASCGRIVKHGTGNHHLQCGSKATLHDCLQPLLVYEHIVADGGSCTCMHGCCGIICWRTVPSLAFGHVLGLRRACDRRQIIILQQGCSREGLLFGQ